MIGIVVVSHSRALAEAAVGLASEMVAEADRPVIAIAAGLDETTFGTDAAAVAEAIGAADSADGVLVLLDLGSAVLSAEMALEFVDPEVAERVKLSSAPLVEGLVAAVVTASTGASLDAVLAEASRGLAGKQDHLGDAPVSEAPVVASDNFAEVAVGNEHGLHARPAAKLVALARRFDAQVTLTNLTTGRGPVDAGSLSMVATLNAQQGHRLQVGASGPDATEALAAISALADRDFDDVPVESAPRPVGKSGSGLDMALGAAIVADGEVDLGGYQAGSDAVERERAQDALRVAAEQLTTLRDQAAITAAAIFDAQLALLDDAVLLDPVFQGITQGESAPAAWKSALDALASTFEGLDDPYQRERAQDVRSVRDRVLRALTGAREQEAPTDGVLVVRELDAATAASLDAERIAGVAVRAAGTTGHGVIVARSRGIPLITGIGDVAVPPGAMVGFDARAGSFVVDPDENVFRTAIRARTAEREAAVADAGKPAVTVDGQTIQVLANVGSVQDAVDARGADGSGLVRTEVLFGNRKVAPTVEEQVETYRAIAAAFGGKPITIRSWDIGGDKPLPFLPQAAEANPFLGERGIRVFRRRPELLRDQLKAICQVALETPVQVMFPMVTTAEEVAWALAELADVGSSGWGVKVGIMVEVPAAALRISTLAEGLDFVSIGTNDLTQYTTAADRGNSAVASLADALDPAVLQLIDRVVRNVPTGVEVAVCGDLASDPDAAVLLAGLGIHELSAVGPQVPLIKSRLRQTTLTEATKTAVEALTLPTATAVRELLAQRA
ncbi:phosphoenolpyruvate--protein phosphotransferase [Kribbella qitaiheensis]|uniref:Phosphocarrier protein HPr n=2 Tax=Kribbella qitaiheensis TaxID=1544730 RepID=A0A7G6WZQ2_9ACTN|nr:phosphoenolpyruvate--protein phosphotransferase [Kribbella qitaiheensis]QNE19467.1 phosphoenolpyruvate--protein phosphotransferase [Kribbella qitaiheensis]